MADIIKHYRQLIGIAKGWALVHLTGWSDEAHRDLLQRHGAKVKDGRISATTLSQSALNAVLQDYERRGWKRERFAFGKGKTAKPISEAIRHIVRLWGRLGQAGKVQAATRPALLAFCARQLGREIANLDALSTQEQQMIIESLKAWLKR